MKRIRVQRLGQLWLVISIAILITVGCKTVPTAQPAEHYLRMNPPPDSDKPLPVPAGDNSCWMHTAANMLAAAGYGNGSTVQDRADDIYADMEAQYGVTYTGWSDTAINWWLGSSHNTWTNNPYTVVTILGKKDNFPWASSNGAREIANELREGHFVGLNIYPTTGNGGGGGHSFTLWGDNELSAAALSNNPDVMWVTDSDTDDGGDQQSYTYDDYTNPNPGGMNDGNGWYFDIRTPHYFIGSVATLSPTDIPSARSVRVVGSYQITQIGDSPANDLHYRVGTDVEILSYRTWLDWAGTPSIGEARPREELTVDWELDEDIPPGDKVTISTEFVEPAYNAIHYSDLYFTYQGIGLTFTIADLLWSLDTPRIDNADATENVTGGYVIGGFDIINYEDPEMIGHYRLVHQYLYDESPERHTFQLTGTPGFTITNLRFGHSYGYPTIDELWQYDDWMTEIDSAYDLHDQEAIIIDIDWGGLLPYPEGTSGE